MDRGTERDGAVTEHAASGRIPLAVVVVDREGLVSHWSSGARRLFGAAKEEAIGRAAVDLLPVSGALPEDDDVSLYGAYSAYDGLGHDLETSLDGRLYYPAAGRARLTVPERSESGSDRVDVLWWAYPLVGPGPERLLVLGADVGRLQQEAQEEDTGYERVAPGFALHTDFPGAEELARRLPEILPSMSVEESARIVGQILELGYPVLEFSQNDRVPVTPDWGVPRRAERRARRERAARAAAQGLPLPREYTDEAEDLEYVAVRERLEFLNEVSGRIGTSSICPGPSSRSARPSCPASPTLPEPICANRSSPARDSRKACRTRPPCGIGSPSNTPTNPAAGRTSCRSARPCPSRRTRPSSSA